MAREGFLSSDRSTVSGSTGEFGSPSAACRLPRVSWRRSRTPAYSSLARFSHHLTVEAHDRSVITTVRLLTVLNVPVNYARIIQEMRRRRGARLVLTGLSRTSPRHLVRKAG